MNEFFNHELEDSRHFCRLPRSLNGHRYFYKGDAPSVKESEQEKAAAEVAAKKWQYYQETYRPLEDTFMKQVDDSKSEGTLNFAKGSAASATTTAFDAVRDQTSESLRSAGVNPNSGAFKSTMHDITLAEAGSSADAKGRAEGSVMDNYVTGLQNVSAIGRGQSTETQYGLHDLAVGAQQRATDNAVNKFNNSSARLDTAGTLAGASLYMAKNRKPGTDDRVSANIYDDGTRRV